MKMAGKIAWGLAAAAVAGSVAGAVFLWGYVAAHNYARKAQANGAKLTTEELVVEYLAAHSCVSSQPYNLERCFKTVNERLRKPQPAPGG